MHFSKQLPLAYYVPVLLNEYTCTPSTDEMRGKAEEGKSHAFHGDMTGSVEFSKNIPVRGQPN